MSSASRTKDLHLVKNCTICCREKGLSTPRLMWTRTNMQDAAVRMDIYLYLVHIPFRDFQKNSLHNSERLDQVCSVRPADKAAVSIVLSPSVFRGNCAWHKTPFVPAATIIDVGSKGSGDVQHRRHGRRNIARNQFFAKHDYFCTTAQAWRFMHDSVFEKKEFL